MCPNYEASFWQVWLTVCEASDAMTCHQLQGFLIENLKSGDGNPRASRTPSSLKTGNQHLLFHTLTAPLSQYLSDFKLLQSETWLMTLLRGIPKKFLFVPVHCTAVMLASKDGMQERWPRYWSRGCNFVNIDMLRSLPDAVLAQPHRI